MYAYMHICIYIYILCVCGFVYVYVMYIICIYITYVYIYIHIHKHIHIIYIQYTYYIYIYIICICLCMCIYIIIYIYIYIYICTPITTYMYIPNMFFCAAPSHAPTMASQDGPTFPGSHPVASHLDVSSQDLGTWAPRCVATAGFLEVPICPKKEGHNHW